MYGEVKLHVKLRLFEFLEFLFSMLNVHMKYTKISTMGIFPAVWYYYPLGKSLVQNLGVYDQLASQ